jgi:hypothetical protein
MGKSDAAASFDFNLQKLMVKAKLSGGEFMWVNMYGCNAPNSFNDKEI